ncbi:4-(cytidine 5'-diphospho)-2-C-methyl-D-erythritol kinase [Rhodobacteraceae bacterium]|nr:4-(cytidine 5'-diphospho)-2-C-methyl-D-erythritol kinase [Paracoccaceae bacterium]
MSQGLSACAPAKVNLQLCVTGRRTDGYHTLESLVVFAGVGDRITVSPGPDLSLTVTGPFAQGVPDDERNLVIKAARLLARHRGVRAGAHIVLDKHLPHGGGIGGGSSDAATALRLLARLWQVKPLEAQAALSLGADVPVCMMAPEAQMMRGIGERLLPLPVPPEGWLVLVNPRIETPTGAMFQALERSEAPPAEDQIQPPARAGDLSAFAEWLGRYGNDFAAPLCDLQSPAHRPQIPQILAQLRATAGCHAANLSGSGSTCWGLFADEARAGYAAMRLREEFPHWWVQPAPILGHPDQGDQDGRHNT